MVGFDGLVGENRGENRVFGGEGRSIEDEVKADDSGLKVAFGLMKDDAVFMSVMRMIILVIL